MTFEEITASIEAIAERKARADLSRVEESLTDKLGDALSFEPDGIKLPEPVRAQYIERRKRAAVDRFQSALLKLAFGA